MASRICWHCGTKTHMTRRSNADSSPRVGGELLQAAFSCDECGRWSIGLVYSSQNPYVTGATDRMDAASNYQWLPERATSKEFPDVPEGIAGPASEAHRCRSIDANRAAILLARAVIEATAKDNKIESGNLYDKIEEMSEQGLIRPHVAEAAHEARHLGNDMSHGDFGEVEAEDADDALTIMDDILLEVYQSLARTQALRDRRAAREAAEQS